MVDEIPTSATFRSLIRTSGLLRRVMEPYFARHGISGAQWGVLRSLHRGRGEGHGSLRLVDLSQRLLVRPPSITTLVERLRRMGLVALEASVDDQRVKRVRLTRDGLLLVETVLRGHPAQIRSVLGALNLQEQNVLGRLLDRVSSHMERLVEGDAVDSGGETDSPARRGIGGVRAAGGPARREPASRGVAGRKRNGDPPRGPEGAKTPDASRGSNGHRMSNGKKS